MRVMVVVVMRLLLHKHGGEVLLHCALELVLAQVPHKQHLALQ
jgi:hypothetical protein